MIIDKWRIDKSKQISFYLKEKKDNRVDKECIKLIEALNLSEGIVTTESCCGHEERNFHIWFEARSIEELSPIPFFFDSRNCGCCGWKVIATTTDLGFKEKRISFVVEGPIGKYEEADKVAEFIISKQYCYRIRSPRILKDQE